MNAFSLLPNLLTSLGILLIVFLFLLLNRTTVKNWAYFLHFSLAYIFIQLLYPFGSNLQAHWFPTLQYSWIPKLLSLVFVVVIYSIFMPTLFKKFGWHIKFDKKYLKVSLLLSLSLILIKCIPNYLDTSRETVTLERWLYQLSLPGLEEEIIFRGLLLVLLREMFTTDALIPAKKFAPDILIITLVFALAHSFQVDRTWHISFQAMPFVSAGLGGFVYSWLRVKHDSLAPAIICHNAVNTLITFAQWIK